MKILALSTVLVLSTAASVIAADGTLQPAEQSNFNNMLTSLSNMLSSTPPKTKAYQGIETSAGETVGANQNLHMTDDSDALPPLPKQVPVPQRIAQPEVDVSRLSPQTRRMLESTPSGIGDAQKTPGGKVSIKRGDFDPEYGRYLDAPIDISGDKTDDQVDPNKIAKGPDGKEKPASVVTKKAKLDIKVETAKTSETLTQINSLEEGLKALNSGQYEGAITLYKSVLQKDPHNRDAMFGLATAYQKAGQRPQAREAYAKLLAAYPGYEPGISNLLVMASNEAPQDALKELNAIGTRNPNFAAVYAQKATIYQKIGDYTNAKKSLLRALNIEPANIVYRYNLAILLDQMGETVTASQLYAQVLEQSAGDEKSLIDRSQISDRLAFIAAQHPSQNKL